MRNETNRRSTILNLRKIKTKINCGNVNYRHRLVKHWSEHLIKSYDTIRYTDIEPISISTIEASLTTHQKLCGRLAKTDLYWLNKVESNGSAGRFLLSIFTVRDSRLTASLQQFVQLLSWFSPFRWSSAGWPESARVTQVQGFHGQSTIRRRCCCTAAAGATVRPIKLLKLRRRQWAPLARENLCRLI